MKLDEWKFKKYASKRSTEIPNEGMKETAATKEAHTSPESASHEQLHRGVEGLESMGPPTLPESTRFFADSLFNVEIQFIVESIRDMQPHVCEDNMMNILKGAESAPISTDPLFNVQIQFIRGLIKDMMPFYCDDELMNILKRELEDNFRPTTQEENPSSLEAGENLSTMDVSYTRTFPI
jgi:hypothetical protein